MIEVLQIPVAQAAYQYLPKNLSSKILECIFKIMKSENSMYKYQLRKFNEMI